jgi:glycosyltransferase involved in cell wall biosynthesis
MKHHDPIPLVTVILRTHDAYVDFIERSLGSVYRQDLLPTLYEVIIAHDGEPSAEFVDKVDELGRQCPTAARMLWPERKYGYYAMSSNLATINAYGHYIAYLDADNEWKSNHLSTLLDALRTPDPETGWPHFAYTRREYIRDDGAPENLPTGPSMLVPWIPETISHLKQSPMNNFVDSSDFMVAKSVLYELAERTGKIWDESRRRFGDWDLVCRFAQCGFRGIALDQLSHIYHWHAGNIQHTRGDTDPVIPIPLEQFEGLRDAGLIKPSALEA